MGKKKILMLAGVLTLLCVGITGCGTKTIDLADYVETEFSGTNTKGTVYVTFKDDLTTDILSGMGIGKKLSSLSSTNYKKAERVLESIDLVASQTEYLSNGDKVSVAVTYDNDIAEKYGIKFKYSDVEKTVEGLKECKILTSDLAFQGLDITCTGVSPTLSLELTNTATDTILQQIQYSATPGYDLKNGDVVTIYAYLDSAYAEENGYLLPDEGITTQMTIEGMNEYVSDITQLTADNLASMKAQAVDILNAAIAKKSGSAWGLSVSYTTPTPFKTILKVAKTADLGTQNEVALVYKATRTDGSDSGSTTKDQYFLCTLTNVPINQNSQLDVTVTDMDMDSYTTYEELYRDWAQRDAADYTISEADLS